LIDLGAWADEDYAIPTAIGPDHLDQLTETDFGSEQTH
jgi:endogenous inhibitor of DNA gyrase (YacG/DUF329 family)